MTSVVRTMLKPNYSTFKWDPIECEKRMGDTVGYRYKVTNLRTEEPIIHMVNETRVTIYHLTPYTNYSFEVQFVNHIGEGPYSEPSLFTTLQGSKCTFNCMLMFRVLIMCSVSLASTFYHTSYTAMLVIKRCMGCLCPMRFGCLFLK